MKAILRVIVSELEGALIELTEKYCNVLLVGKETKTIPEPAVTGLAKASAAMVRMTAQATCLDTLCLIDDAVPGALQQLADAGVLRTILTRHGLDSATVDAAVNPGLDASLN